MTSLVVYVHDVGAKTTEGIEDSREVTDHSGDQSCMPMMLVPKLQRALRTVEK